MGDVIDLNEYRTRTKCPCGWENPFRWQCRYVMLNGVRLNIQMSIQIDYECPDCGNEFTVTWGDENDFVDDDGIIDMDDT